VRDIDVKVVVLDITGFSRLHSTCLLERKGENAYMGTCRKLIFNPPKLMGLS